jgi:hypothetical protein
MTACDNGNSSNNGDNGTEPTPPTARITNNNQTVTLAPELEIDLNGTATKGTNEIYSYEWTLKSATVDGVTPVFTSGTALVTKVTGIKKAGTYVFELKVKDTADLEGTAEATVTVTPWNATKTVTLTFPTFVREATTLNLTPTYTPTDGWGDFSESDITYTISDNKGHSNLGNIINASLYNNMDEVTFTLTFKQGSKTLNSQSFYAAVLNMSGLKFADFFDNDTDWDPLDTIPPVTLTLTKTITEILPPPTETKYELGDTGPGGGKIFYYSETGFTMTDNNQLCHYLEAAPADMDTELLWRSQGSNNINLTAETSLGTGRKNTYLIVTTTGFYPEPILNIVISPAAQAFYDYRHGGKSDWFLPSKDELNLLYINRAYVNNFLSNYYWSSTGGEGIGGVDAYSQNFLGGSSSMFLKNPFEDSLGVRAIRAF